MTLLSGKLPRRKAAFAESGLEYFFEVEGSSSQDFGGIFWILFCIHYIATVIDRRVMKSEMTDEIFGPISLPIILLNYHFKIER